MFLFTKIHTLTRRGAGAGRGSPVARRRAPHARGWPRWPGSGSGCHPPCCSRQPSPRSSSPQPLILQIMALMVLKDIVDKSTILKTCFSM